MHDTTKRTAPLHRHRTLRRTAVHALVAGHIVVLGTIGMAGRASAATTVTGQNGTGQHTGQTVTGIVQCCIPWDVFDDFRAPTSPLGRTAQP